MDGRKCGIDEDLYKKANDFHLLHRVTCTGYSSASMRLLQFLGIACLHP